MLYPLTFKPLFKERIWGARNLERLYAKPLPPGNIGESWEIVDREGDQSIVANGSLAGRTLHELMQSHGKDLLGSTKPANGRFPLLIKLLDCADVLSLQVHPPAQLAATIGGEPKTEMWYIAEARDNAQLFVGLKKGVSREHFESCLTQGTVADCFHRVSVLSGDAMFLPSGRVHALGAGLVIFEIQQNSDTTYRVFDWNRKGADGKPRQLHVKESLQSIDFNDLEPALLPRKTEQTDELTKRSLVNDPLFKVEALSASAGTALQLNEPRLRIFGVVDGALEVESSAYSVKVSKGGFCLLPASLEKAGIRLGAESTILHITTP